MAACDGVVQLRRAKDGDAQGIARVHVVTWQRAYRELLPADYLAALSVERRQQNWANELGVLAADRRPWVAHIDESVIGFVSAGPSRDEGAALSTGEVYALYVLPDCWDRGLGRNLLRHAERDLVQHGYADATLWVLEGSHRARRFYDSSGWRLDGALRVERIGDREVNEVRYRRDL
jgi:ribosomal protein S18 acetylase RimI-like enzyme